MYKLLQCAVKTKVNCAKTGGFLSGAKMRGLGTCDLVKCCSSSTSCPTLDTGSTTTSSGLPEPPTNCCMSGCANCVWIQYAEVLVQHYQDGGKEARRELNRLVTDPTLKMFLKMELNYKLKELSEKSTPSAK